jgi:hypothetical protein
VHKVVVLIRVRRYWGLHLDLGLLILGVVLAAVSLGTWLNALADLGTADTVACQMIVHKSRCSVFYLSFSFLK